MSKIRVKFSKLGELKYISHLDMMRVFQRAIRRCRIEVKHSEGFNPHPAMSFSTAIGLGLETDGEYMDIELIEDISPDDFIQKVNVQLPEGLKLLKGKLMEPHEKAIMAQIRWGSYAVEINNIDINLQEQLLKEIENFMLRDEIIHESVKKKKGKFVTRQTNIREMIGKIEKLVSGDDFLILKLLVRTGSEGNIKPEVIIDSLKHYQSIDINDKDIKIKRIELYIEKEGIIAPVC